MKKIKIILWLLIGGVILMTASLLNGCSFGGETIPKNRTKEQYEFEKTFEPLFKFLEQDKKEFNGLEAYKNNIYVKNGNEVKEYKVDLDTTQSDIKGNYTITMGETKETVHVTFSNGTLHYESEITPLFDEKILNLVIKRDHFASLDVKETFKSAETELRDIIYQPEHQSELFKNLKNKYDLPEDTTCQIRLYSSGGDIYGITIQIKAQEKTVEIDLILSKK